MKVMIKRKNVIGYLLSFLLIILSFVLPVNREILLAFNFAVMIATLFKTRLSIISLCSIVTNYVVINVYAYDISGIAYGILGLTKISFVPMLRYMLIWNLSLLFWGYATRFTEKEKEMLSYDKFNPGKNFSILCSAIAILSILIAFPSIPFVFVANNRFNGLLPGNAWNHLSIVALLFMLPNITKYKFVLVTYGFVFFWFLSHYERVDVLGVIVVLGFIYLAKNHNKKNELKKIVKIAVVGLAAFVMLSFLGESRMGSSLTFSNIFKKLVTQNTASDVGYMYDLAIRYVNEHSLLNGITYIRYFLKFIPGVDLSYLESTNILAQYYAVPGGSFILNEPLMNFGLMGVVIIPNLLISMIYMVLRKKSNLRYMIYIFLLATPFRYLWYGIEYIETGIVIFIPIIYILYKITKKGKKYDIC